MTQPDRFLQLLGLMALGCHLKAADGHIWIEEHAEVRDVRGVECRSGLHETLKAAGCGLNNKIYGGVFEALDTIDAALIAAGSPTLERRPSLSSHYFLGPAGVDHSRIDLYEPGVGGLV